MTAGRNREFTPDPRAGASACVAMLAFAIVAACSACGGSSGSGGDNAAGNNAGSTTSGGENPANTARSDRGDAATGAGTTGTTGTTGAGSADGGRDAMVARDAGAARSDASTEFSVQGDPQQEGFVVNGTSDLPEGPANSMQPYARIVESAVAPSRAALTECFRPLGPPLRRYYRLTIEPNGLLVPRPPQPSPLPQDVNRCIEGLLHAITLSPPPPRELPYDLVITVSP